MTRASVWAGGPRVPGAAATLVASMLECPSGERAQPADEESCAAGVQQVHVQLSFVDGSSVELPADGSTSRAIGVIAERIMGPGSS